MKLRVTFSGSEALAQAGEHSFYFRNLRLGLIKLRNMHPEQFPSEKEKILQFTGGSHRDAQELQKLGAPQAATPFCNVCDNRTGSTPHLAAKPESFFGRKLPGESVDQQNVLVATGFHSEFVKVLGFVISANHAGATGKYPQLNTLNYELRAENFLC